MKVRGIFALWITTELISETPNVVYLKKVYSIPFNSTSDLCRYVSNFLLCCTYVALSSRNGVQKF